MQIQALVTSFLRTTAGSMEVSVVKFQSLPSPTLNIRRYFSFERSVLFLARSLPSGALPWNLLENRIITSLE